MASRERSSERYIELDVVPSADAALERAFASLEGSDVVSATTLREAIWAYVDDAKGRDEPPERVIVGIKEIARHVGVFNSRVSVIAGRPFTAGDTALQRAVTWCIERYYAEDPEHASGPI